MERMVRKQVYIEPIQEARLKKLVQATGLKEAELIRRGIDLVLSQDDTLARRQSAFARTEANADRVSAMQPAATSGRVWSRDDLYDR